MHLVHIANPSDQIPPTKGGAVGRIAWDLTAAQAALGHQVTLIVPGEGTGPAPAGVNLIGCGPAAPHRAYSRNSARAALRVEPDLVQLHAMSLPALWLKRRIPVVSYVNYPVIHPTSSASFPVSLLADPVGKLSVRMIDRVVACSDFSSELFRSTYGFYPAADVSTIRIGVNIDRFRTALQQRDETRSRLGWNSHTVYAFVGRICLQKGVDILLDSFPGVEIDDGKLALVGPPGDKFPGPNTDALDPTGEGKTLIARAGELPSVTYMGNPDDDEMARLMAAIDILVLPTRKDEMFGMVLVEAMASGRRIVASRLGGIPEVLAGCETARLAEPADVQSLTEAMTAAAHGLEDVDESSVACSARFSWERVAQEFLQLYRSLT